MGSWWGWLALSVALASGEPVAMLAAGLVLLVVG